MFRYLQFQRSPTNIYLEMLCRSTCCEKYFGNLSVTDSDIIPVFN